jgi:hypothetical protein
MGSRYRDWLPFGRPWSQSSSPGRGKIFSSLRRPDRFWRPPSVLSNGYTELFPGDKAVGEWRWPITFKVVPRSRIQISIYPLLHTNKLVKQRDNFLFFYSLLWGSSWRKKNMHYVRFWQGYECSSRCTGLPLLCTALHLQALLQLKSSQR